MKDLNYFALREAYRAHNEKRVNERYCMGSICGVWDKNGELWCDSVGFADLAKTRRIDRTTVFRLASMTKPVTAVAFLQMVEQGKITLDTPIAAFLPAFENMRVAHGISGGRVLNSHAADTLITPRHLLSHSSGLGSGAVGALQEKSIDRSRPLSNVVRAYAEGFLDFEPETNQSYSPLWAFDVLARLVELLSDMPYADYVKQYIFDPLGMADTSYCPSDDQVARDFFRRLRITAASRGCF